MISGTVSVHKVWADRRNCWPQIGQSGSTMVNESLMPLKHSRAMPSSVECDIPGWQIEAYLRLDPHLAVIDFLDRMVHPSNGKPKPTHKGLVKRRDTDCL